MTFKERLAQGALTLFSSFIEEELNLLLEQFEKNNGQEKTLQLKETLRNGFLLLRPETEKTKTKIDDTVVDLILNVVK